MITHAIATHPEESCGLLATDPIGSIRMFIPTSNAARSETSYVVDPKEHFSAIRSTEAKGWEITGVFHSHPATAPFPSADDIRLAPDPTWLYLVLGPDGQKGLNLRAFSIRDGESSEHSIVRGRRSPTLAGPPRFTTPVHDVWGGS